MARKVICYHGTSKGKAEAILGEGFRPGTYFALHLEDALGFGGRHVFSVVFPSSAVPREEGAFQFRANKRVPPNRIVSYKVYGIKEVQSSPLLREEVFESNLPKSKRKLARAEFNIEQANLPRKEKRKKLKEL